MFPESRGGGVAWKPAGRAHPPTLLHQPLVINAAAAADGLCGFEPDAPDGVVDDSHLIISNSLKCLLSLTEVQGY